MHIYICAHSGQTCPLYQFIWLGEIAQWLRSLSVKRAIEVRARHNQFVPERWNSIRMLVNCPTSVADQFDKGCAMCYHVCVIMHVKVPQLSVVKACHRVPLAGFCLSLYSLHVLNRDVNIIYFFVRSSFVCLFVCSINQSINQFKNSD